MRISDWSSDVCSSDLKVAALNEGVCKMRGADHHRVDRVRSDTADLDQRADGVGNARADIGACGPLYGAQNRLPGQQDGIRIRPADIHTYAHPTTQIGRASCRSRVCQYV